jgi:isoleucyl-tRNA synthetase
MGDFLFSNRSATMAEQPKKHFLAEIEEQVLQTWADDKTFEASLAQREGAPTFNFYDGPPFANGVPHYGHLEQTTIKDTMTRYKTMRGFYVPRRVGWDCHGLPVEYAIEKEHGFKGKKDILDYGIDKFNAECRESVFKYQDIWEKMFNRVGRWADYDNTYATMDESYIESVWWVFNTIYDKGLIYKDFRSSPYCPRCATPLSNFELNQGYQDNVPDPSLYVKFKLTDEDAYLLGWTTTPWSLPGNAAIAVNPEAKYVYVELKDDDGQAETLVLARDRLEALSSDDYHIVRELHGHELVGKAYEPLFELSNKKDYEHAANLYKVWAAEFVSIEEGSGVLHVAPAFGEDDLLLGKQQSIPVVISVDESGHIRGDMGLPEDIAGKFFKNSDKYIIEHLTKQDSVFAAETFTHTYPFCWRCDTPLLYYATDSWQVRVTGVKEQLIENNNVVNWTPGHIKAGRFGNWLENARDWAISRNRYWGAPLPVWVTDDGEVTVIGSVAELKERAVDPSKVGDLHRPYIDDVEIKTDSGKIARRIPEVFDCWFESGSMPYAQDHYPFKDKEQWEQRFPANFIAEAIDQTRGWFYTLHVLATALFDKPAFENVICSGWIVAADGEKLSKRKKNYAPMDEVFDQYGVDTLRFFMASSPLVNGEDTRFSVDFQSDDQRGVFMTLQNIFNFYKLYADVDGWKPSAPLVQPESDNVLDQWMLARLNQTTTEVTKQLDAYRLDKAARPIAELLDDASNWFVRRSRRRFWKSENDHDKNQAYATLHYTLLRLCQLLAPFSPFLPDHLWRQLVAGTDLPKSVHLSDWPEAGKVDQAVLDGMAWARAVINDGLSQRAAAGVKVRQPLSRVKIDAYSENYVLYGDIIADELNVKEVEFKHTPEQAVARMQKPGTEAAMEAVQESYGVQLDTTLTPELKREGLMREVVRQIQSARKQAGLEVDDRIDLALTSDSDELKAMLADGELAKTLQQETLATSLSQQEIDGFSVKVRVEGSELTIALAKAR